MATSKDSTTNSDSLHPRLQKVLASGGLGSRRDCEELIREGRVEVDREIVTELGTRVDPDTQTIRVDGVPLKLQRLRYFAVHKPTGVLSTSNDPSRRLRVIDLVDSRDRVFTIGRLDKESSGLILVTNDGELANRMTHPRYGVEKVYQVTVVGTPDREVIQKLRRGLVLAEGPVRPESVTVKKRLKQSTVLEIVLTEGKNREIRRMLARVDHKVVRLHRIAVGPIRLGQLPKGAHRELSRDEVRKLRTLVEDGLGRAGKKSRATKKSKPRRSSPAAAKGRPGSTPRKSARTKEAAGKQSSVAKSRGNKSSRKIASADALPKMGAVLGGDPTSKPASGHGKSKTQRKKR